MDKASFIVAGVIVSAIGALFYNTLPIYLGAAQDHRGLTNEQIGFIGTAFFLGYTLASSSAFFWIRRVDWRAISYTSLAVSAFGLLLAGSSSSYSVLIMGVFVAGCGLAAIYAVGTTLLGDTSNAARWYGAKITAEAALGVFLLILAPAVILPRWGFFGLSASLVFTLVLFAPAIQFLPSTGLGDSSQSMAKNSGSGKFTVWMALVACALFMCGQTAIWGFVERIGASTGFEPELVGTLLAISLAFAVAGSLVAVWMGNRMGCIKPLIWAHIVFFLGLASLLRNQQFEFYAVGACLILFSVGLGITYSVSTIAELDPDGRFVVLSVPAIGVGVMIGPGAAGWLADGSHYGSVLGFGFATLIASLAAFLYADRLRQRVAKMEIQRDIA
jgi:predicted MFS family arabinose efflux permease